MKNQYYTDKVTSLDDGTYRWYYDMDMYQNKSMLYTLEKVNLFIFLGISIGGALLVWFAERNASFARGILLIGLAAGVLMALLYAIGFYIAAWIKRGHYRIHFLMQEEGIKLTWANRLGKDAETGREVPAAATPEVGYRGSHGGKIPRLNLISNLLFNEVSRYKCYPKRNMIDISRPGGKFQVYTGSDDFAFVEQYIHDHVPERAQKGHR